MTQVHSESYVQSGSSDTPSILCETIPGEGGGGREGGGGGREQVHSVSYIQSDQPLLGGTPNNPCETERGGRAEVGTRMESKGASVGSEEGTSSTEMFAGVGEFAPTWQPQKPHKPPAPTLKDLKLQHVEEAMLRLVLHVSLCEQVYAIN